MKLIRYQIPSRQSVFNHAHLLDEVDRLFATAFVPQSEVAFPVDLYHDKEAFVIRAELPGFRKEDLTVEVADKVLTLQARYAQPEVKEGETSTNDRTVSRSIPLPDQADATKVAATYENGVLTVTLPKREEVKPRQVTVEVK